MVRVGIEESIPEELLSGLPPEAQIVRVPAQPTTEIDVDLWILTFPRKETKDIFTHLRGVRVVQSLMAGVDWILPWLPKDITLCDGRGIHDISTSEWVLSVILATMKRLPFYRDQQHAQEWRGLGSAGKSDIQTTKPLPYKVLGEDLSGKTVLIVGYGSIGSAIESRLQPFGVNVLRIARSAKTSPPVSAIGDLHSLLPQADIVVLIVPATPETKGLIGAPELALMKPGALLVNAARGPVVVTDALVEALNQSHIRAALDVTDPEPLPPGHPLWAAPNCLITPHVGGSTPEFIHRAFRFAAQQIQRMAAGEPLENIVTDAGY
jgi:phosphoglycerate dehydrogenase-like enzyme